MSDLRKRVCRVVSMLCAAATWALTGSAAQAGDINFGKVGEPVKLVVGYQPYYTESWSGVVMRGKKFYEKYLPKGSKVDFAVGLQGAIVVNAMLAGKQHIGYVGDMPGIVSTTKQQVADIRIVATLGLGREQCNIFLARKDAPAFATPKDALKWLDGKNVAVPKGSCADRFAQETFKKEGINPGAYLNQNIEVITSGFRAGKLDAAVVWEPTASRLVQEGLAKRVASGTTVDESDGGFLTMREDLIRTRPDVVKAWLNAELDAQLPGRSGQRPGNRPHGDGTDHRIHRARALVVHVPALPGHRGRRRPASPAALHDHAGNAGADHRRHRLPVLDQEHQRQQAPAGSRDARTDPGRPQGTRADLAYRCRQGAARVCLQG